MTALGAVAAGPSPRTGRIALAERYRSQGRSFKQEGCSDEAQFAWRQALDLLTVLLEAEPNAPELRRLWCDCANDLAWLQANHPDPARRDPEAAVAMARRMVEAYPEAETYWNTLGVAYYRAGDDVSAVAALDRATALGGGTAFDDVFLALAQARLGDQEEARRVFARARWSARSETTPATPSWPASASRPNPSSPTPPVPRPRPVDVAGDKQGSPMRLLVVIVSYRVTDLTIDCLHSLSGEIGRIPGARVAVCENGTGGDAEERLRRAIAENGWDSWVDLTTIYPNRGFTGGNNAVIRPALQSDDPPEYVLLLNADTTIKEHALEALVSFLDTHPRAGIAGSKLVSPDGKVESTPFRFPGIATELDRGLRLGIVSKLLSPWGSVLPKRDGPFRAGWVSGASLILRRAVLEQVGLLDEGLYTYFDDPDICLRAARAGWETWYVPESQVVHLGGATTGVTGNRPPAGVRPTGTRRGAGSS